MNSNTDVINSITPNPYTMANILVEMKIMGIDPDPFLKITALDLLTQYGPGAIEISDNIEKSLILERDYKSAKLWHKITHYLKSMPGNDTKAAH
ncbi:MAG: hypothetical protein H6912_03610 [Kordiimonadaceae bacterium]|nr:hypothetical protein [Kordiimonadaceae bacterium]